MKSFALAILLSTAGVMAERLLSCGHHLVNGGGESYLIIPATSSS
jgi:hypothetical protein